MQQRNNGGDPWHSQSVVKATSTLRVDAFIPKTIKHDEKGDPDIVRLNKEYALVLIGDKVAILREKGDEFQILSVVAFREWLRPYSKIIDKEVIPLASYWLQHTDRRQYEGIIFAPGRVFPDYYNLWRGFAVQPKPGDCSKFKAHLKDNICRGDENLYLWVCMVRGHLSTSRRKVRNVACHAW